MRRTGILSIIFRYVLAVAILLSGTGALLGQGSPAEECASIAGSSFIVKFQMPNGDLEGTSGLIAFVSYNAGTDTATFQNISGGQLNLVAVVKEGTNITLQNIGVVENGATFNVSGVVQQGISHVSFCGLPIPTPTPTDTPTNTPTSTPTDTPTNTPTSTPTDTPTNTPTNTPTSTPTDTPTNTPTSTPTDTPTNTPTNTPTSTPTDTPTNTPTSTPTDTPTNTPTNTPTSTPTDTPTNTPTSTPTDTPTNTPTPTSTSTPTDTPTNTPTPTDTPTNTPTPDPFEGCTPGYWKVPQHFDSWTNYVPDQTLESVFDVPDSLGLDNSTLLQALNFAGGTGVTGAARNLLRAAVAALLNGAQGAVDYPLTDAQVVSQVNAALSTLNRNTLLGLAGQLDSYNNLGCPLN